MKSPVALFTLFVLLTSTLRAAPATVSLKWNELGAVASGRQAIVQLQDRSSVRVRIRSIEATALIVTVADDMHVRYKRGQATIPREEIVGMEVRRRGKRGRVIGTTTGAIAGLFGGGGLAAAAINHNSDAAAVAAIVVLAAGPLLGYTLGSRADGKNTTVILLPD